LGAVARSAVFRISTVVRKLSFTYAEAVKTVYLLLLSSSLLMAQEQSLTLDDLAKSAEEWAVENLDEDALAVLQSADQKKIKEFLARLEKEFHAEYVLDLAQLKQTAQAILPLLEQFEETLPYAIWLKNQIENLEVAERLRRLAPPPPKPAPEQPRKPSQNPSPDLVREVWVKKIAERHWPPKAKQYVSTLKSIFSARKVPPELVWIAEVESSFDARARSPAGAAGLFQLMPATARRFGLRTWPIDQRLKAEPSAGVAAQYLKTLHGRYNDWRLTLAAYNAGEGRVDKLLTRHKAGSYDKIAKYLPAETQLYVPRVEATILRREGIALQELRMPVFLENRADTQ
jgi:membrane-bound lytic murein transglycosylase D